MEEFYKYTLNNRLRIVFKPTRSPISYCGVMVDVGSRDETNDEIGMAHFIEHMIFKGTEKRKSRQIIDRLENVGGELNAFTTKEETALYAAVLTEYTERAVELIADMVQNSTFPQEEIEKELTVILDEIKSYQDSPAELIVDDYEEYIYGTNALSHNILGTKKSLKKFNQAKATKFFKQHYRLENMIFFVSGNVSLKKVLKWSEKYFVEDINPFNKKLREKPTLLTGVQVELKKRTYQNHTIVGYRGLDIYHDKKVAFSILNNIVGGPGMNSLLNVALREKNGLLYSVESIRQSFTDNGWWGVYFGTVAENNRRCIELVHDVLKKVKNNRFTETKLNKYKKQYIGQVTIASENQENSALGMAKSMLKYGEYITLEKFIEDVNAVTPTQILTVANNIFNENECNIFTYY